MSVSSTPRLKARRKKDDTPCALPGPWPSAETWLPVADVAMRASHAAHCVAAALRGRPQFEDTVRFLTRRAEMLLRFVEALIMENRCEERFRQMTGTDLVDGMKATEAELTDKVKELLIRPGLKLQMVKLLENEALLGQISRTRLQLALMEPEPAPAEPSRNGNSQAPAREREEPTATSC